MTENPAHPAVCPSTSAIIYPQHRHGAGWLVPLIRVVSIGGVLIVPGSAFARRATSGAGPQPSLREMVIEFVDSQSRMSSATANFWRHWRCPFSWGILRARWTCCRSTSAMVWLRCSAATKPRITPISAWCRRRLRYDGGDGAEPLSPHDLLFDQGQGLWRFHQGTADRAVSPTARSARSHGVERDPEPRRIPVQAGVAVVRLPASCRANSYSC